MLVGRLVAGASPVELSADTIRSSRFTFPAKGRVPKLSAYLDGLGLGDHPGTLTVSGNEITDALRALGLTGDGRLSDSSTGIWEGTTNLVTNGNATTNTAGATQLGGGTVSITRSTSIAKFGTTSFGVACDGAATNQGAAFETAVGLAGAPGDVYTGRVWLFASGADIGKTIRVFTRITNTDASTTDSVDTLVTLAAGWQEVKAATATVIAAKTGDKAFVCVRTQLAATLAYTVNVGGCSVEKKPIVTPYTPTARANARVQAPTSLPSLTQGWFAACLRMGVAYNYAAGAKRTLAHFRVDANNFVTLYEEPANGQWALEIKDGGTSRFPIFSGVADTFQPGDLRIVVGKWSNSSGQVAVGGAAFGTAVARAAAPAAGAVTSFDIGSLLGSGSFVDSEVLWFAGGSGQPTDADSATIFGFGTGDRVHVEDFPASPTFFWPGVTSAYMLPGIGGTALVRPVIHDVAGNLVAEGDEIQVPAGTPAHWFDLPFSSLPSASLAAQDYELGFHVGGATNIARAFENSPDAPGGVLATDLYSDGAGSVLAAPVSLPGRMAVYAEAFDSWTAPREIEFWYARLPWLDSQAVFSATAPVATSERRATVGWHGTSTDGERGAFAVAATDGPFASLVGERVRVRELGVAGKSVYVYVHALASIEQDLSLPRRAFMALGVLGVDDLLATVTRMA